MLTGVVLGIKRGLNKQYQRDALVKVEGFDDRSKASSLIGAKVELAWRGRKVFKGKVTALHGDRGVVVARFRKPLPGGVAGSKVKLIKRTS